MCSVITLYLVYFDIYNLPKLLFYVYSNIDYLFSSIWSNEQDIIDDNDINAAIDSESSLDFKFSSFSINSKQLKTSTEWPNFEKSSVISDNETNAFFESNRCKRNLWPMDGYRSLPVNWKRNAEAVEKEHFDDMMNLLTKSLMKLNHCRESSCFKEIIPKSQSVNQVSTKKLNIELNICIFP